MPEMSKAYSSPFFMMTCRTRCLSFAASQSWRMKRRWRVFMENVTSRISVVSSDGVSKSILDYCARLVPGFVLILPLI